MKDRAYEININPTYQGYQNRISKYGVKYFWQESRIEVDSDKQSRCECKWWAGLGITQTSD